MTALTLDRLPDPDVLPEFYDGVPTRRALAWIADIGVIFVLSLLLLPLTLFTALFFFPLMMAGVGFLYRWFTLSSGSATWGMRLFNIELREATGSRFSSSTALVHTAGYALSVITFPAQLVSIGAMALTPRRQGLTDLVMGTTAINRPA